MFTVNKSTRDTKKTVRKRYRNTHGRGRVIFSLTSEDLVEKDFDMVGAQGLRRHDDLMEVALHQLRHHVSKSVIKEPGALEISAGNVQSLTHGRLKD